MVVRGSVRIERPIEEVFDFVADERNEPRYNPRMIRADKVTEGPIGVGTKFRSVMTGPGRKADMTIEFTGFNRPWRIVETTNMSNMKIKGVLLFEPIPHGTRLNWLWDVEARGLLKLLGPLVRQMGARQETRIWTALKAVLEERRPTEGAVRR